MGTRRTEQHTKQEVLSYIVRHGISSRKEIAEKIGVTNATLTHVVSSLIENGIVYEIGTLEEGKVGRKQVMLDTRQDIWYIIGFDVTNITIRITVLNLHADILEMRRWDFLHLTQEVLEEAIHFVSDRIKKYGEDKILGIGLLVQGYLKQNICLSLPVQNIKEQLSAIFPVPITIMNNVKGLAIAESYFGNPCKNYVMIKYGPGIGGVVVVDGKILEGYSSHAGELGHIVWEMEHQKQCMVCGKKGCLESCIGFEAVIERANANMKIDYPNLTTLLKASENDNGEALADALKTLARAVNIFSALLDPEKIMLAGEIFKEESLYQQFLQYLSESDQYISKKQTARIINYSEKRLKAAGIVVLNEYFGNGHKSILTE